MPWIRRRRGTGYDAEKSRMRGGILGERNEKLGILTQIRCQNHFEDFVFHRHRRNVNKSRTKHATYANAETIATTTLTTAEKMKKTLLDTSTLQNLLN